jgi:hypothetical protein
MAAGFALATSTPLPHNAGMVETHPFSIGIEDDPSSGRRFRWALYEGGYTIRRSPHSYATRREAEKVAAEALKRAQNGTRPWPGPASGFSSHLRNTEEPSS